MNTPLEWDLPDFSEELSQINIEIPSDRKLAIVRPATVRKEWLVSTRPPDPKYIGWCSHALIEYGYHVISVADIEYGKEELLNGQDVYAHQKFYQGEIPMYALLELMKKAEIVVGGVGFIVPASVSAHTNLFCIFGGCAGYNTPYKILHASMDLTKIKNAMPDNPCRCILDEHNCNKFISNLDNMFMEFLAQIQNNAK